LDFDFVWHIVKFPFWILISSDTLLSSLFDILTSRFLAVKTCVFITYRISVFFSRVTNSAKKRVNLYIFFLFCGSYFLRFKTIYRDFLWHTIMKIISTCFIFGQLKMVAKNANIRLLRKKPRIYGILRKLCIHFVFTAIGWAIHDALLHILLYTFDHICEGKWISKRFAIMNLSRLQWLYMSLLSDVKCREKVFKTLIPFLRYEWSFITSEKFLESYLQPVYYVILALTKWSDTRFVLSLNRQKIVSYMRIDLSENIYYYGDPPPASGAP
jgi:hypothetical protein